MPSRLTLASASEPSRFRFSLLALLLAAACGAGGPGESPDLASAHEPALTWKASGALATARTSHTATLLPSGKVLVAGGRSNPVWVVTATAELYDPFTRTWSATGSMGTARQNHTATLLPTGKVLVAGGGLATAELYDPAAGTWSATGPMAASRYSHTATLLQSGKVLVTGGNNDGLASAELYDPATGTWSSTGSMTSARTLHTAALLASGKVLVAGGYRFPVPLGSAEVYDPATGLWTATPGMAAARKSASATRLGSGKVLVAGGDGGVGYLQASAELYDPAANTWTATGSMSAVRAGHSATLLRSGRVLVVLGGAAEVYDPSGTWTAAAAPATSRSSNTVTLLSTGRLLAAGGIDGLNNALATSDLYGPPSGPATSDLDGDGRSDILWRSLASGQLIAYLATGSASAPFMPASITTQTSDWQIAGSGDFNGDGRADLLWRSGSTGAVYAWLATGGPGTATFRPGYVTTQPADWVIAGLGDFDGDGKTDILWRNASSGVVYAWLATGASGTSFQPAYVTTQAADWQIVGIGDFNGDGRADLLWRSTATGAVYAYLATGATATATFQPAYLTTQAADWQIAGTGDFDGDGKSDILWRSASTGAVYAWLATGTGTTFQSVHVTTQPADWVMVGIGDYDGDWRSDILWRSASTGAVYAWYSSGKVGAASFQPSYLTTQEANWQIDGAPVGPSAARSTVEQSAGIAPADGTVVVVTVTVNDTAGRPMVGQMVQLTYSGIASMSPTTTTTDGLGRALFQVWTGAPTSGLLLATVNPGALQTVVAIQPPLSFFDPAAPTRYVAMGDSFQSGLGAGEYDPAGSPPGFGKECYRSAHAYPTRLYEFMAAAPPLDFVACAGAQTKNIWQAGSPHFVLQSDLVPQIFHANVNTELVTIGIGGNDLAFAPILALCILDGFDAFGSCRGKFGADVAGRMARLVEHVGGAPNRLETVLGEIRIRAPRARVVALGYPRFFPVTGPSSCMTFSQGDQTWINDSIQDLNAAIAMAAANAGVEYVDIFEESNGLELCSGSPTPFLNNVVLGNTDESFHPTPFGQEQIARRLGVALRSVITPVVSGTGTGSITCNDIACGPYPYGAQVTVRATAGAGSRLESISGSGSTAVCAASPCPVTLKAPGTVTAVFTLAP